MNRLLESSMMLDVLVTEVVGEVVNSGEGDSGGPSSLLS